MSRPLFTKRHYDVIAAALLKAVQQTDNLAEQVGLALATHALAHDLARDNPRFQIDRFLKDSGCEPVASRKVEALG